MPFTQEQFFGVFARYNEAVWPSQFALVALGIVAVAIAAKRAGRDRIVAAVLAFLWAWAALVYHAVFFRQINPAAIFFAVAFLIQSGLFLWYGAIRQTVKFSAAPAKWRIIGTTFVVYALFLYPMIAVASGQRYPEIPTFGVPCPVTIFTLGLLIGTRSTRPVLWAIPVLWSLVATQAALRLGVAEDFGLTAAAVAALWFAFANGYRASSPAI